MKFRATIELNGKTATGLEVPPEVVAGLGPSKRPAVRVTLKGYTYRSSVASMGGRFLVGVSAEVREKAGVAAGDKLEVTLELDTEKREITVPPDLQRALDRDKAAQKTYAGLSYSNQRRLVEPIEQAKTDETRARRIAKAVSLLHEGRA